MPQNRRPIPLDVQVAKDGSVKLLILKTAGVEFKEAAARVQAFANAMSLEMNVEVKVEGQPEMHSHGPRTVATHTTTSA